MPNQKNTAKLPSPDDCRYALATLLNDHEEECCDNRCPDFPLFPPKTSYCILRVLNEMLLQPPPNRPFGYDYTPYSKQLSTQLAELARHCKNLSQFLEKALRYATILKKSVDYAASHEPDHP